MTKQQIEELRQEYIKNPPEGMSKKDILNMSDDDLLDMDYFLHEDEDDIFDEGGFFLFWLFLPSTSACSTAGLFLFLSFSRSFL